jgi:DNA polymerase delta subunit 1
MKRKEPDVPIYESVELTESNRVEEKKWGRPLLPSDFSPETHSITFQQMDVKYYIENRSPIFSPMYSEPQVPVIKMYGCSQEGYSVTLSIYNFVPYIYVQAPMHTMKMGLSHETLCTNFRAALDDRLQTKIRGKNAYNTIVSKVELVDKMSIMYYQENTSLFFKISFTSPLHVPPARSVLEEGCLVVKDMDYLQPYTTYESNIAYILRCMVDTSVGGASWVKLPEGKYRLVPPERRKSNSTVEAEISYENLEAYAVDDVEWSHIAPLRILSFDIECAGRPFTFPTPDIDPVIQIANYVQIQGQEKPIIGNVFVLRGCNPIAGIDVRCFNHEADLLREWIRFVISVDPDLLTGWNIEGFDLGYIVDRGKVLGIKEFDQFSRIPEKKVVSSDAKFSSAQTGTRKSKEWVIEGRVVFDMYRVVVRDHKLSSYTLNNVASNFLKQQKEDLHYSQITVLFNSKENDDRRRLAVYCCKDAILPLNLMNSLMSLINSVEMARVTGVPFTYLLSRGQGIKVVSQILRKIRDLGILMPAVMIDGVGEGFQGAKVIDPKVGYYNKPVFVLDFSSLYPSIMQANNLCYTTLIIPGTFEHLIPGVDYTITPNGHRFIKSHKKKGILTIILTDLLTARSNAKDLMNSAPTKAQYNVYNSRQLALKVSANSVYGFTGQSVGSLPCLEISSSVTAFGREMIYATRDIVQAEYSIANGYPCDAEVIYGDTDSVMVCSGVETVAEAMALGKKAAALVTTKFIHPIKLEFEKVYYPWLLMSKKKYAGLFWTKPEKWDKLDCKGIESVRRDNCGLARYTVKEVLDKILVQRDTKGAVEFCKKIIGDIYLNKIEISLLIITKAYSKTEEQYKNPQAHVELAKKMAKRNPSNAPGVGDRVPFVIIAGEKNDKLFQRSEDPLYVMENEIPIDTQYYIDQIIKPLCRILGPIIENPLAVLTTGDHTKHIVVPKPKGMMGNFFTIKESCLGCKSILLAKEKTLCQACREGWVISAQDVYQRYLNDTRVKELEFTRLWTHCQDCQGSRHREVMCAANDCPIFYKRTKAHKDLIESRKSLLKFDLSW